MSEKPHSLSPTCLFALFSESVGETELTDVTTLDAPPSTVNSDSGSAISSVGGQVSFTSSQLGLLVDADKVNSNATAMKIAGQLLKQSQV